MAGAEIAAAIWPFVKVAGYVVVVLGALFYGVRTLKKSGGDEREVGMRKEAERGRIEFERDRTEEYRRGRAEWDAFGELPREDGRPDGGDDA